jgi:hypothetical protein
VRRADNFATFMCRLSKSGSLNLLECSGSVMGLLDLYPLNKLQRAACIIYIYISYLVFVLSMHHPHDIGLVIHNPSRRITPLFFKQPNIYKIQQFHPMCYIHYKTIIHHNILCGYKFFHRIK